MIDFSYNPAVYTTDQVQSFADGLEAALRHVIKETCPRKEDREYRIEIEGRLHGPISRHLHDLSIRIDYHEEWRFSVEELDRIAEGMRLFVERMLQDVDASTENVKIRFYARVGYKGVTLS